MGSKKITNAYPALREAGEFLSGALAQGMAQVVTSPEMAGAAHVWCQNPDGLGKTHFPAFWAAVAGLQACGLVTGQVCAGAYDEGQLGYQYRAYCLELEGGMATGYDFNEWVELVLNKEGKCHCCNCRFEEQDGFGDARAIRPDHWQLCKDCA